MKKLTQMQKNIRKEKLIELCIKLHPTLNDEQLNQLKWHYKYNWVIVQFSVKDYGFISFGIDNHKTKKLVFGEISLDYAKQLSKDKEFVTEIWRFVNDKLFGNDNFIQRFNDETIQKPNHMQNYKFYKKT